MGLRNAVVRKLGVADLTTTVLTLTITGLAADSRLAGGDNPRWQRRSVAIVAMLAGAFAGARMVDSLNLPPASRLQRYHGRMGNRAYADRIQNGDSYEDRDWFGVEFLDRRRVPVFRYSGGKPAGNSRRAYRARDDAGLQLNGPGLDPKRPSSHDQTLCGGPTGLPKAMANSVLQARGNFRRSGQPTRTGANRKTPAALLVCGSSRHRSPC